MQFEIFFKNEIKIIKKHFVDSTVLMSFLFLLFVVTNILMIIMIFSIAKKGIKNKFILSACLGDLWPKYYVLTNNVKSLRMKIIGTPPTCLHLLVYANLSLTVYLWYSDSRTTWRYTAWRESCSRLWIFFTLLQPKSRLEKWIKGF